MLVCTLIYVFYLLIGVCCVFSCLLFPFMFCGVVVCLFWFCFVCCIVVLFIVCVLICVFGFGLLVSFDCWVLVFAVFVMVLLSLWF